MLYAPDDQYEKPNERAETVVQRKFNYIRRWQLSQKLFVIVKTSRAQKCRIEFEYHLFQHTWATRISQINAKVTSYVRATCTSYC